MHRTVIKSGVDDELDAMKRTYDGLDDLLDKVCQDIAATIPEVYDLDLNVIFFPQIGFLISIHLNPTLGRGDYEGGEREDQSWTRIFSTGDRVYYKDSRMKELDNTFGDMYSVICGRLKQDLLMFCQTLTRPFRADKEIDIVHELGQKVLEREGMLNLASNICGELDRHVCKSIVPVYWLTTSVSLLLPKELDCISTADPK